MPPALNSNCATPSSLQARVVRSTRPLLKPMSLGEYSLEAHLNFVTQGDAPWDGTPLPTQYQTHLMPRASFFRPDKPRRENRWKDLPNPEQRRKRLKAPASRIVRSGN